VDPAPWFAGVWLSTSFRLRFESWPSEAGSFFFPARLAGNDANDGLRLSLFLPRPSCGFFHPHNSLYFFFVEGV
jgi:hypothetical protein